MDQQSKSLFADVEKIKQIPVIHTLLEVICRTTRMGFAVVARVTEDRWIACSVRDEIAFGLKSGEELPIQTTICNEVRHDDQAVIIDHVSQSEYFCNHPTPKLYGFESYISVPIRLKNGEFFGTLCAIDPRPAKLSDPAITGLFTSFADLIAFHLQSLNLLEQGNDQISSLNRQLTDASEENRQYQFIANHSLQEPLRQLRLFTSMLLEATEKNEKERTKLLALKVNTIAQRFSKMVGDLATYSSYTNKRQVFETIDLTHLVKQVLKGFETELKQKSILIMLENLPVVEAVHSQMFQLFEHLIRNSIRFAKPDQPAQIHILASESLEDRTGIYIDANTPKFVEILISDDGIGISPSQQEKIFDVLNHLSYDQALDKRGISLPYCRRIVQGHQGSIDVESELDKGTTFSIILPLTQS